MIIEFSAENHDAAEFSRTVRQAVGPDRSVRTVEAWLHDDLLLMQHTELVDAIYEMKNGLNLWSGTAA